MEPVGRDSAHAIKMLNKKRLELAYEAAGGEIKEDSDGTPPSPVPNTQRRQSALQSMNTLDNCRDRQGKSGYGIASRTTETYEYRLGFLAEFRPEAKLSEIDGPFIKEFLRFLRRHPKTKLETAHEQSDADRRALN